MGTLLHTVTQPSFYPVLTCVTEAHPGARGVAFLRGDWCLPHEQVSHVPSFPCMLSLTSVQPHPWPSSASFLGSQEAPAPQLPSKGCCLPSVSCSLDVGRCKDDAQLAGIAGDIGGPTYLLPQAPSSSLTHPPCHFRQPGHPCPQNYTRPKVSYLASSQPSCRPTS